MDVRIDVDRARCIGSGQCVHVAPGAFEQDDDAKAFVAHPGGEPEDKVVHAVTACPVQAITLYLDGVPVGPDDLKDWARGARCDDPVVALLELLCEDHETLRGALGSAAPHAVGPDSVAWELTRDHLRREAEVYETFATLVDPGLVLAFVAEQRRIDQALDELAAQETDSSPGTLSEAALARVLGDHIHLEESVLFPSVLAALAKQ
jgi:ferredoxin